MEVVPSQLRRTGQILHELAAALRGELTAGRAGPGDPAWAADRALSALANTWEGTLAGLAFRLADAGDRLVRAADAYTTTDALVGRR